MDIGTIRYPTNTLKLGSEEVDFSGLFVQLDEQTTSVRVVPTCAYRSRFKSVVVQTGGSTARRIFVRTLAGTFYPPSLPRTLLKNNHPSNYPSIRRFSRSSGFFFIPCCLPCQCHCFFPPPFQHPIQLALFILDSSPRAIFPSILPSLPISRYYFPPRGTVFIDSFRVIVCVPFSGVQDSLASTPPPT